MNRSQQGEAFGYDSCEKELKELKEKYSDIFFQEVPFCEEASDPSTYLIIGRRGSGKTALSHYFGFSQKEPVPILIDVDEPNAFNEVLADFALAGTENRQLAILRLEKIWRHVIWCIIARSLETHDEALKEMCDECDIPKPSGLVLTLLNQLKTWLWEGGPRTFEERISTFQTEGWYELAESKILEIASRQPIYIAVDTLEKYDPSNEALMNALAALIQFASKFNETWAKQNLHLKVFIAGEIYPYLQHEVISNTAKYVRNPVNLFWRPKDLLRLICWRLYKFLSLDKQIVKKLDTDINWENPRSVYKKVWVPYFGKTIRNGRGLEEESFSYILRHTQMRPRQLIHICNTIARSAENFPHFREGEIVAGVKIAESQIAAEILNSYSEMYPKVSDIITALVAMPMIFDGNELDKRAPESASNWATGTYTPYNFKKMMAELGVVGRVVRENSSSDYIDAEFEYSLPDHLVLTHRDRCVIHPMFFESLRIDRRQYVRIMPFSTQRDLLELSE